MLQRFFIEFIVNTSFLLLPLLVKISLYGLGIFQDWLNILFLILILVQTYFLAKFYKLKNLYVFLLNIIFVFIYYLVRGFFSGFNFLTESIYIFFTIFLIINAVFRTFLYKENLLITAAYNFFKVEIIPIFYYFVLLNEGFIKNISLMDFFLKFENRVLLFIFTFFAIFYSILIYILRKKEQEIQKIHNLLKDKLKYTINGEELLNNFIKGKLNFETELKEKVVVFMDIRGFTSWSEKNKNNFHEVTKLLNNYYDIGEKYLKQYNGKIDKFIGDAIMYTFDNLDDAIKFAQKTIKEEIKFLEQYGLKVGIGINKGFVIKGWLGSKNKKEETVIGDVVNTAARLEGGENEIKILKNILPSGYEFKEIGKIKLKGKEKEQEVVSIYY